MEYRAIDDLFFDHEITLSLKAERKQDLDEHLQTYGRRHIDWEIRSDSKKPGKDEDASLLFYFKWFFNQPKAEAVRFKRKSDAMLFKLSWTECEIVDPYKDLLATKWTSHMSGIGLSYPSFSSLYPQTLPYDPSWIKDLGFKKGINGQGQYELDFDGSIARYNESMRSIITESDMVFDITKARSQGRPIRLYQAKSRVGRPSKHALNTAYGKMANPCTEIDLGGPELNTSDVRSYDEGGEAA